VKASKLLVLRLMAKEMQIAKAAKAETEQTVKQLEIQIATDAPKEKLLETANMAVIQIVDRQ
jgi:hypothetical protein